MSESAPVPRIFQAAVERSLSVLFRGRDGALSGHDYRVEVVAETARLDAFDVVVDFRDLEAALDTLIAPLDGRCLEAPLDTPEALCRHFLEQLSPRVPAPARLSGITLADGRGRRLSLHA
nr:6-carboxytetrahydropterin synthase [uncultured Holophaga sp.]